jgi:hypothetical protein
VRRIIVAHAVAGAGSVEVLTEHQAASLLQPQPLLKLQRTHRGDRLELVMETRDAHRVTPIEIKEIVYQTVPYVGMAKVFDFIHTTNEVLTERGVALPLPGQSTTTPETRAEQGLAVQKQIVGSDGVAKLYASAYERRNQWSTHDLARPA